MSVASERRRAYLSDMGDMNITLPEPLKTFVEEQVTAKGLGSASDYFLELVQRELDRERLRALILEGANSPPGPVADDAYFEKLARRIDQLTQE